MWGGADEGLQLKALREEGLGDKDKNKDLRPLLHLLIPSDPFQESPPTGTERGVEGGDGGAGGSKPVFFLAFHLPTAP